MSKKISSQVKENIIEKHQNGLSNRAISREQGIAESSIRRILSEKGNKNLLTREVDLLFSIKGKLMVLSESTLREHWKLLQME